MKSVQFFPLILWYFMFGIKILIFWEKRIDSGPIFYMPKSFFGQITTKNLFLCSWEITKKSVRSGLKIFIFRCDNIRKKYINNGTDAWRQYISAKNALFKSSFANGVVTCVVVMKCEWKLKCKQMFSCCFECWVKWQHH